MPFTRVSLLAGKPPAYLAAISDSLDRALVESFNTPEADRFMAFDQLKPGEFVFDRTYRGGPRSDDFVVFHITTGKQRSPAMKERFFRHLVELLGKAPGIRPEDVMIIVANSEFEDWSFSSGVSAAAPVPADAP